MPLSVFPRCRSHHHYTVQPKRVRLVGYAGDIEAELSIGDCILATEGIQYKLDLRAFGLQRVEPLGRVPNEVLGELSLFVPPSQEVALQTGFSLVPGERKTPILSMRWTLGFLILKAMG